jgi:hypothetical protein
MAVFASGKTAACELKARPNPRVINKKLNLDFMCWLSMLLRQSSNILNRQLNTNTVQI